MSFISNGLDNISNMLGWNKPYSIAGPAIFLFVTLAITFGAAAILL